MLWSEERRGRGINVRTNDHREKDVVPSIYRQSPVKSPDIKNIIVVTLTRPC